MNYKNLPLILMFSTFIILIIMILNPIKIIDYILFLILCCILGFQIGFLFTGAPLVPKLSKLNPLEGIKRLCSMRSLAELIKSIFKLLFVGSISFFMIKGEIENIPSLIQLSIVDTLLFISRVSFKICFYTFLALIILSLLDRNLIIGEACF